MFFVYDNDHYNLYQTIVKIKQSVAHASVVRVDVQRFRNKGATEMTEFDMSWQNEFVMKERVRGICCSTN